MSTIFKNILVFRSLNDCKITIADTMPVTLNFDPNRIVGKAFNIHNHNGDVYADIEVFDNVPQEAAKHCFPYAAGFMGDVSFDLKGVSIGTNPNADPDILRLSDYLTNDNRSCSFSIE